MTSGPAQLVDLSFLRRRDSQRRIATVTIAFGVIGLVYALASPKWYPATVTVAPTRAAPSAAQGLLGGEMGGLAAAFTGLGGGAADTSRIAAVLESTAVADAVIAKLDLQRRYDTSSQEATRDALREHCSVKVLPKPGLVQLTCEDTDPEFVRELVSQLAQLGNEQFRRVNVGSASEEVRFLERRVADLRRQADEAAARMREFQETHQIVDLDSQARALVSSVAALNTQRITKELELDYARTFSSGDEPGARQLESQLSVVDEKLRDLGQSTTPVSSGANADGRRKAGTRKGQPGMFPSAQEVPRLRAEYEKLLRDRRVAETTLVFSLDRLEAARASEARDVSTFVVLDPPTVPTRKSRPKRLQVTLNGAALGFLIAAGYEFWRQRAWSRRTLEADGKADPS